MQAHVPGPAPLVPEPRAADVLLTGVRCAARLAALAELDLPGHAADPDLDAVVDTLASALDAPLVVVDMVAPDLQTYPAERGVGVPCTRVPDAASFCAEVVETGRPLQVRDAREHAVYRDNPLVQAGRVTSYAGSPLVHRGAVLGAVSVFDPRPRTFSERELGILTAQARLAATVLTLRWTASHDPLTGLANRRRAAERVAALADGPAALLFVDVDDFKQVNDRLGHLEGDRVLRDLAALLGRRVAGTAGLAARWGGDEFVLLLPGTGPTAAHRAAQALVREVRRERTLPVSVTVGVATAGAQWRWEDLLSAASGAAALGKAAGKDRVTGTRADAVGVPA